MNNLFDVIVIGSGPGGYHAAIRAAQLGLNTAIVEKDPALGGTCLNVGCIPSKALLDSSERYEQLTHSITDHGISVGSVKLDIAKMMARKSKVVKELTDGIQFLMNKNKITVLRGHGSLLSSSGGEISIQVTGQNAGEYRCKHCILASGSEPIPIPNVTVDQKSIITSDQAIALEKVPDHLIIIGAGVIGLELGSVWKRLGSKVTIVEMLPSILMGLDRQLRELTLRTLTKQGLEFLFEHGVTKAETKGNKVIVTAKSTGGTEKTLEGDKLLVAVGRRPFTSNLGLDKVGVALTSRGRIEVNPHTLQTNIPGIYAIGDVIDGGMLAHRAMDEGVMVAELIAGKPGHVNYETIPWVVYTWPEVAWVGKSEDQLRESGVEYSVGKFNFMPSGRAKAMNESVGMTKIFADKRTDKILGAAIVGPNASELIAECVLAMEFGASSEDLARTMHAHPTLSETVKEAAADVLKTSIHQ